MTIDERFENLQRELNRARQQIRRILLCVALCLGLAFAWFAFRPEPAMAQGVQVFKELRAVSFHLVDVNGKVRAAFIKRTSSSVSMGDWPVLALYDENSKERVTLAVTKLGPTLIMCDENGNIRADMSAMISGPAVGLYAKNGKPSVEMSSDFKFGALLNLYDASGRTVVTLP